MKIGILTYHYSHNFGAMMQAYALRTKVKELVGYEATVDIINYMPATFRNLDEDLCNTNFISLKNKRELFLKNQCGVEGISFSNIKEASEYDCYIVGSDQVWNPSLPVFEQTSEYFLDFVDDNKVKIAYAASIGEKITSVFPTHLFEKNLPRFDYISIRESSYIPFVEKYAQKKCVDVLDPTFLISKDYYYNLMSEKRREDKYIMCIAYALDARRKIYDFANRYSIQNSCFVVDMERPDASCFFMHRGKSVRYSGIEEILGTVCNAEMIFTDSYHYVVFSIIFHKPFYVMLTGKPSRITDLLEYLHLENRILRDGMKLDELNKEIDYEIVDDLLRTKREKSIEFLKEALDVI